MIEYDCPTCQIPLRIPKSVMGQSGTCKHCGQHFALPSLWRYRVARAWAYTRKNAWPATSRILWRIANFNSRTPPRPTWRDDPMTERQREFLLDLGAEEHQIEGFSKGQATDMISILKGEPVGQNSFAAKLDHETAKAIQSQTNFQKNACGCLILLLLAPLWIPAFGALVVMIGVGQIADDPATTDGFYENNEAIEQPTLNEVIEPSLIDVPLRPPLQEINPSPSFDSSSGRIEEDVYIAYDADGIYHKVKTCTELNGKVVGGGISVQLKGRGMSSCNECVGRAVQEVKFFTPEIGVVYVADRVYHYSNTCDALNGNKADPAMIEKAKELGMNPCSNCWAGIDIP